MAKVEVEGFAPGQMSHVPVKALAKRIKPQQEERMDLDLEEATSAMMPADADAGLNRHMGHLARGKPFHFNIHVIEALGGANMAHTFLKIIETEFPKENCTYKKESFQYLVVIGKTDNILKYNVSTRQIFFWLGLFRSRSVH